MGYYRGDHYRMGRMGDYYRGDPGFFSFLGNALKGVVKVASGIVGVPNLFGGGGGGGPALPAPPVRPLLPPPGGMSIYSMPSSQDTGVTCPAGTRCVGASSDGMCLGSCVQMTGGLPTGLPGGACMTGFHLNKSRYVTRGGGTSKYPPALLLHEKHSTCVKTRRLNVGNARALRRALRRARGFAKLAHKVLRATHQYKGKGFSRGHRRK